MMTKYLTTKQIIDLNQKIIKEFGGGSIGILNKGNLDFIVSQMRVPKDIYRKAAYLMRGIIEGHVFLSANKRTGIESAKLFLRKNGKYLILSEDDTRDMSLRLARGDMSLNEVTEWLKIYTSKSFRNSRKYILNEDKDLMKTLAML